ncbi:MAG: hypothetical protein NC253_06860 [Ruminococcus sp.]|nr:hypothetical protein [Ruminococcus sp.]
MEINDIIDYFRNRTKNFTAELNLNFDNPILLFQLSCLYDIEENLFKKIEKGEFSTTKDLLIETFSNVYDLDLRTKKSDMNNDPYDFFDKKYSDSDNSFYKIAFEACLFFALCYFIHNTKRLKHKSLTKFIHDNPPYENYNEYNTENSNSDILTSDAATLRQHRHRLMSKRGFRNKNPQWNTISNDAEHEWKLYFKMKNPNEKEEPIFNIYKRLHNLYNKVYGIINSDRVDITRAEIETAYKKFEAKLNKIKYSNYLKTCKFTLDYIFEEEQHYGINVYRLEKEFRIYENIYAVNELLNCKSQEDEKEIIDKSFLLRNVWFPKVREKFITLDEYDISIFSNLFSNLLAPIAISSSFIFDKLVEKNKLGENWEKEIHDILFDMSRRVFYVPSDLDFSDTPNSQEKFVKYLASDVQYLLLLKWNSLNKNRNTNSENQTM